MKNLVALTPDRIVLDPSHAFEALDLVVDISPQLNVVNPDVQEAGIAKPHRADRKLLEIAILEQLEDMPV